MWPPKLNAPLWQPVAMLDLRKRYVNRRARRAARHGRPTLDDKLSGRMTPKQMRESGL